MSVEYSLCVSTILGTRVVTVNKPDRHRAYTVLQKTDKKMSGHEMFQEENQEG